MTFAQQMITLAMCVLGTMAMRFLPFAVFSSRRPTPAYIQYLGKALPAALFGMLVIYCLKGVELFSGSHGLPEAIALLVVLALHLWRRQTLLSISVGTICYMIIVQNW